MGIRHDCPKASSLTDAGTVQISVDGETWNSSFPDGFLVAGSETDFFVRVDPASLAEPDNGTYEYDFAAGEASGGLTLINNQRDIAHVTGTTPADQVGLTLTVSCTVIDKAGNSLDSTPVTGEWAEPEAVQVEPAKTVKATKSTK